MSQSLVPTHQRALVPSLVAAAGTEASKRFLEFFTANIRNRNTRAAYVRAVADFFGWCEQRGFRTLGELEPVHVAGYIGPPVAGGRK